MNIKKLMKHAGNPKPYDQGTANMWTDEHISQKLLEMHIDGSHDIASRDRLKIDVITESIENSMHRGKLKILDLGCGPGLYAERFASFGHDVTGIDFSRNSIDYAIESAAAKGLKINYLCQDYLDLDYVDAFDMITLIYCDFGVLSVSNREILISKIYQTLHEGGVLIFDALNSKAIENLSFTRNYEISEGGFWDEKPYLCLSESFHFEAEKATLDQHVVIDEYDETKIYRFWNHYFDFTDVEKIFTSAGFSKVETIDIALDSGPYNDRGVTFYKVTK